MSWKSPSLSRRDKSVQRLKQEVLLERRGVDIKGQGNFPSHARIGSLAAWP